MTKLINKFQILESAVDRINAVESMMARDDGWTPDVRTWTYASATTFTIPTDVTVYFPVGTKIKLTQTTVKYFYVIAVSYGAPNTTITVTGGSDYSLVNAAITSPFYSYTATPQGFPPWFNWTPTLTGFSADPTNCVYRFYIVGRACRLVVRQATAGTSNATGFTMTAPAVPSTITNATWGAAWWGAQDNGASLTTAGRIYIGSASNIITITKDMASGAWTGANGKKADFNLEYEIG